MIGFIETDLSGEELSESPPKIKSSGGIEKAEPASFPSFLSLEEAPESFLPVLSLLSFPPAPPVQQI